MRTFFVLLYRFCVLMAMLCYSGPVKTQALSDDVNYQVSLECVNVIDGKTAIEGRYFIQLDIDSFPGSDHNFEIILDGSAIVQFNVDSTELPYTRVTGPHPYSGHNANLHEYVLKSLDDGRMDTLEVAEVVCGFDTNNGLNRPGFYCDNNGHGLIAQAAPDIMMHGISPDRAYVYICVDKSTGLVFDVNGSGLFSGLNDITTYDIFALAVAFEEVTDLQNEITIGSMFDQGDPSICYALCGIYPVDVDCSSFDLDLSKDIVNGLIFAFGDTVEYDITVHNAGIVTAYDIQIKDNIPDDLLFPISLNPGWVPDGTSPVLDSLPAGDSYVFTAFFLVNNPNPSIVIDNSAEIIFAGDEPGDDTPAFDVDSTPGNDIEDEDDQDNVEILVLENLCQATFDLELLTEPVCPGGAITLIPVPHKAKHPVSYQWYFNGNPYTTDSSIIILNPTAADYGVYELYVEDNNGCKKTITKNVQPIQEIFFSCISSINLSVSQECGLILSPSMFTNEEISGIEDYLLEVTDLHGNAVDLSDLSNLVDDPTLEVKIIDPCTEGIVCWSHVHLEFKIFPTFDHYSDSLFASCARLSIQDATSTIEEYNGIYEYPILSAQQFEALVNEHKCLFEWSIITEDSYVFDKDVCKSNTLARIYMANNGQTTVRLDTAILVVDALDIDSIQFPGDIANLSCVSEVDAHSLGSFPYYYYAGDSIEFRIETDVNDSHNGHPFCNIVLSYSDVILGEVCEYGAQKIRREWSALDWCTGKMRSEMQFLFIKDEHNPIIDLDIDTLTLYPADFECLVDVDLSPYISIHDNCDLSPEISIALAGFVHEGLLIEEAPVGIHNVTAQVVDQCDNVSEFEIVLVVEDKTPPVAVLIEHLTLTYDPSFGQQQVWLYANQLDVGSHDFGCGPVKLKLARHNDVELIRASNGHIPMSDMPHHCLPDLEGFDMDEDQYITVEEIYQEAIPICCEDIDQTIRLAVSAIDQWGNTAYGWTTIDVVVKTELNNCDDNDPCTVNDRQIGDCPCIGDPVESDFDQDGIIDCNDDEIVVCINNSTTSIQFHELQVFIDMGAVGGECPEDELATIAGTIQTELGDGVQYVMVDKSNLDSTMTNQYGRYAFEQVDMQNKYQLSPERLDDPTNGVTVLDLVLIQEHILSIEELDSPYKLISADANNDGRIGVLDLLDVQKLILGLTDQFSNNDSWRFVPRSFTFDDPAFPFPFGDVIEIENLENDRMNEDWIGMKIGDVTQDAVPNQNKSRVFASSTKDIAVPDMNINAGEDILIEFSVDNDDLWYGLQLGMLLGNLELVSIHPGQIDIDEADFAYHKEKGRSLSIAWYNQGGTLVNDVLFTLVLKSQKNSRLSKELILGNDITRDLVYTEKRVENDLHLGFVETIDEFDQVASGMRLYQNRPNPFSGETLITFDLPEAGDVDFLIYNVAGEVLYERNGVFNAGQNELLINETQLRGATGLLYYQMTYKGEKITRSMFLSKN